MNIIRYEHVGTRVTDRKRALAFYKSLGFEVESDDDPVAIELINKSGLRINLIVNADSSVGAHNSLMDEAVKYTGHTHIAFVVSSLVDAIKKINQLGIVITEGPKTADRRRYFFIRDPDGNVIELNEVIS